MKEVGIFQELHRKKTFQRRLALLIGIFFAFELLFLLVADFPIQNPAVDQAVVTAPSQTLDAQEFDVSGVGWTDFLPTWLLNLFVVNDTQIAGVGWTDFLPTWLLNLFLINDTQIAGVGWTDFLPTWLLNLFLINDTQIAGVGWTDFFPSWFFNIFSSPTITA